MCRMPVGAPSPCRSTHGAGRPRWTAWSAPSSFPRALSAISETYGDWIVKCQLDGGAKLCTLGQTQFAKETNQQIFAIELIPRDGKAEGNILMPFGLKFDAGAVLKLDGKDLEQTRFSTCTAQGCLLPVSFPTAVTDTTSKAKMLTVAAQSISNGQAVVFNVPLNGFAAALERTIQLGS
ncbi:invasion protein IalB [Bradyrhizobium sp. USDA 4501]